MCKKVNPAQVTKNFRFSQHKNGADKRGLDPLPKEVWEKISTQLCFYCSGIDTVSIMNCSAYKYRKTVDTGYTVYLNGIDRIDSKKGYEIGNIVPCCWMCNKTKGSLSLIDFIDRVCKIYMNQTMGIVIKNPNTETALSKSEALLNSKYAAYSHKARTRNKDPLPKKNWLELVFNPCYYCGGFGSKSYQVKSYGVTLAINGIDRIDSGIGYVSSNIVPCCPVCNGMKLDSNQSDFLDQINKIFQNLFLQEDMSLFEVAALGLVNPKGEAALKDAGGSPKTP